MQASIGKADRKMEDRNISVPDLSVSSFQAVHQARISPAKGRIQQARAKPPKATTRPPQGHILGIDSGVQSHPKATPRLHQGSTKAPPKPHQSHTKATPKPHQSHPQATPKLPGGLPAPWSLSCTSQTDAGCPGESWELHRTLADHSRGRPCHIPTAPASLIQPSLRQDYLKLSLRNLVSQGWNVTVASPVLSGCSRTLTSSRRLMRVAETMSLVASVVG